MWRLFTSVDFAVLQIIFLAVLAVIGMTIRQVPDFALRSATDYAAALEDLHARYDPLLGAGAVDALDRLSVFTIFRSPWFSAGLVVLIVSIIVCTLDRTPRLWRGVSDVRVAQPEPYFDPILPDRAAMDGVAPGDDRGGPAATTASTSARRPPTTARGSSTAIATSTPRWRRCSPTSASSCSSSPRRSPRASDRSRASSWPRAAR